VTDPTYVLAPHDDGRWCQAELLSLHRVDGVWRVTVTYSTGPGLRFWRGLPADQCRPPPEPEDDEHDNAAPARG
jgi:hypothetical protein